MSVFTGSCPFCSHVDNFEKPDELAIAKQVAGGLGEFFKDPFQSTGAFIDDMKGNLPLGENGQ